MQDLVIGSGPAGVSVATALLARGHKVTLIDIGAGMEPEALHRRDALATTVPGLWDRATRTAYQAPQFSGPPGQVRRYGSDFAMVPGAQTFSPGGDPVDLRASHAAGGLSNLWGSAVLPYRQGDIDDWPVTASDLGPHYRAVAGFLPVAGRSDDLEALFPEFPMTNRTPVAPSPQARKLLERLAGQREALAALGLRAGMARQAVAAGCQQCGMCLHGCPWGYIYSAAQTLKTLQQNPAFTSLSGRAATGFSETPEGVRVTLEDGTRVPGARLFLAAGVLETARLLLASTPGTAELTLKDSQHAFLPMLSRWGSPARPDKVPFHTLPQAFLELDDAAISPRLVHAQIYTWNEFFAHDLVSNYGRKLPGSAPLWRWLATRLIVAQIFLHSDHSARIHLKLAADGRLATRVTPAPDSGVVLGASAARIAKAMAPAGLTALGFSRRDGAPGSSFHVGGSVPMAADPVPGQSDRLGRPKGLSRVHVVDASVLPSIPATTITFSVMANAHRIGSEAP